MLILSTFTSDYLQPLLQDLLKKFTSESINIKYVNKNLIGELLNLKSNLEEKKSYATLFRISDFLETSLSIDETKLKEHLDLTLNQIVSLKQEKELPFLVFLCPNSSTVYGNNPTLEAIEKKFIERLNENKIHTLTLSNIKETYGDIEFENPIEDDTHIPYTPEFYTAIACLLARKLHAIIQKPFKVIAVDCDNTLWDGVAGDLGIEGVLFKEHNMFLQNYLVDQQKKGIIICLCSKNDEQTVLDVFKRWQEKMPLQLTHILKYKVNWIEKSKNILDLAQELNLNPDSFRFIDDNAWEINEVSQIPGLLCITMPQNLKECRNNWIFDIDEHSVVTETDKKRSELYKQAEIKTALVTQFRNPIEYLRSSELGQSIVISKVDLDEIEAIERISQLSGKTNQFNLFPEARGKEVSEINEMITSDKKEVFVGRIKDNFSSEDITAISMCSIEKNDITIDNCFVSCRSFGRGMEFELLKDIAQFAEEKDKKAIKIKFKKSQKNTAASIFLDVLSEKTNKAPIARFLLNQSRNYAWIYDSLKFVFKKVNLCLDFSSLGLKEEVTLTLPVRKLIELELDSLIYATLLKASKRSTQEQQNKKITLDSNDKISEKYLIELKEMAGSLDYLINKFFIDNKMIKSISELENRVKAVCNRLLGEGGQDRSLVARGLDSLKATELRSSLYDIENINIEFLKFLDDKTTVFSLIKDIRKRKVLLEKKSQLEKNVQNNDYYNQILPVSFQQQRIWFSEQKEQAQNSANYHMTACYKASKQLDISRFKLACQKLIELYDAFGTSFFMQDGTLNLSILAAEARKLNFQVIELKPEISIVEAIELEISKPGAMESESSLIRFVIFEDANNYHIFIHVHHAIFDAVSLKNCLDSLSKLYQNILIPHQSQLLEFPPQYIEFIRYQQEKLSDETYLAAAFNFWQRELSKIEIVTTLPTDQPLLAFKPATEQAAERYTFSLLSQDLFALKNLAKSTGVTCFSALSALFSLLIASYTYQENITLVTATNGRGGHPTFYKMIGFFVNLLVQQFNLEKNQLFVDYIKKANKNFLASQEFQDIPFNKIQEILSTNGVKDILLSPAFIYQSYSIPELNLGNEATELEIPERSIIFDKRKTCRFGHFTLFAQEINEGLSFVIEYAKDLFSTAFIEGFAENFLYTIRNVCDNPNQSLQEISVVCDEQRSQLTRLSQGPKLQYVKEDNLVKRFQRSVEKYPDYSALCYNETRLSYSEVDRQSTNLAHALSEAGVKQGNYVGIFLDANHLFFIAELAILKMGAVFIPLSKEDPYIRLKSIIDDAKIKFFIVDNNTKDLFDTDFKNKQLISINSTERSNVLSNNSLQFITSMEDKACILYTSGSTGVPKGVVLSQKALFRVIETLRYMVTPGHNIAQTANQAFDAAQLEFLLACLNGACLVIFDKNVLLNEKLLTKELLNKNISVMWLTAGLFNLYALKGPEIFSELKYLISGGDVVDKQAVEQVISANPNLCFINGYGPTETGIFALTYTVNKESLKKFSTVPIGRPTIANTNIFILNVFNSLAPLGAIGQLHISGDGLGGYHNNEILQKKCFIPYPKNLIIEPPSDGKELPTQIYMSGDKVQFKHNEILFLERMNQEQIKIRGNLVSLAEIQNAFEKHPSVKQAEIVYKELSNKNKILVVFYIKNEAAKNPSKEALIRFLSTRISHAMIPSHYEQIATFPLTPNAKLDRTALSKLPLTTLEDRDSDNKNISESLKKIQTELLQIFTEILKLSPSLNDDFFYTGGDSIKAVQLIAKIEEIFDKRISFNLLRQNSSVRSLSHVLERGEFQDKKLPRLLKGTDENALPIIFIHPAGGGLFCFDKLMKALTEANLPNYCYGIEDPVIFNRELKKLTIPAMATTYLKYIRDEFKGPVILAGYSFGGMVALEIAAQLEKINQNSLGVILLDTWVVSEASKKLQEVLLSHVLQYCEDVIKNVSANQEVQNIENLIQLMMEQCRYYQKIGFKFIPSKLLSTPVSLFKADELGEFKGMGSETESNYLERFLTKLSVIKVRGNHFNLLEEESNVRLLGANIVKYVEKLSQETPNAKSISFFSTSSKQDIPQKNVVKPLSLRN